MELADYLAANRGRAVRLAAACNSTSSFISQLAAKRRQVPDGMCPSVERATDGLITCESLRTDIAWVRIPDPDWPWHPAGRPAIDVTVRAAAVTPATHPEVRHVA